MMLSFIIPAYNLGAWLDLCLASILAQTVAVGWEVVVVDDGSSDDTGARADAWARRDTRVHVFHFRNGGENVARQRGLQQARGEYVWFVDGDDQVHPEAFWVLCAQIRHHPEVEIWRVWETVAERIAFQHLRDDIEVRITENPSLHIQAELTVHYAIYRKKLLDGVEFDNLLVGADLLLMQKLILRARYLGTIEAVLYGYQMRSTSIMHRPSVRRTAQGIEATRRLVKFYGTQGLEFPRTVRGRRIMRLLCAIADEVCQYPKAISAELREVWAAAVGDCAPYVRQDVGITRWIFVKLIRTLLRMRLKRCALGISCLIYRGFTILSGRKAGR